MKVHTFVTVGMRGFGLYFGKGTSLKEAWDNYRKVSRCTMAEVRKTKTVIVLHTEPDKVTVDDCLMIHYPQGSEYIEL